MFLNANAQTVYSDFENEVDPSKKSVLALQLYDRFIREDLDSIKIVGINLLLEANVNSYTYAVANRLIGSYQIRQGEFKEGIQKLKRAAIHFEKMGNYDLTSELYNDIGHGFYLDGEFDEALESYKASIMMGKAGLDETARFNGELGVGKSYIALGDTSLGLHFIHEYKNKSRIHDKFEAAADAYGYLAIIAEQQHQMHLAHEYLMKSYQSSLKSNSKIHFSHALTNRAIVFFDANEIDSAIHYFNQSLKIRESLSNPKPVVDSYHNLAVLYQLIDSTSKSEKYFEYAIDISKEHGFIQEELDAIESFLFYGAYYDSTKLKLRKAELDTLMLKRKGLDREIISFVYSDMEKADFLPTNETSKRGSQFIWIALIILGAISLIGIANKRSN